VLRAQCGCLGGGELHAGGLLLGTGSGASAVKSPGQCVEHARRNGLLAPDVGAAHCYVVDEADVALLAETRAAVAHCPLINAVRGHIAPVAELLRRGVTVGLGIDNMFADYFDVVRACVLMARIRARDATTMLTPEALDLATMGGARALGLEREIGSIEAGKRADLVVLDYRAFGLTPTLDPVQNLVYHAHARDVETALVDAAQDAATAAWDRFVAKYGGIMAG
jgi:5-methylthioadenosine/S-adenosylhomocysteine deaminase